MNDKARGELLYVRHCAGCHGERGDGVALAARYLFPRPRDFRQGRFRLVSTVNGVPTEEDLVAVIERGMPGSAMPPWPALAPEERSLLARRIIAFHKEGVRAKQREVAEQAGVELPEDEIEAIVANLTTPGQAVAVPDLEPPTDEAVERGKTLYLNKGCASCHGNEGRGDGQQKMVDAEGLPTRPRDLTRGIYKGRPDPQSVYIRIRAGMPGSPMPASAQLTDAEVADLVHFVLSLSDEKTRQATVLNREQIVVRRIPVALSIRDAAAADAADWAQVPPVRLRMTPLWWRDDADPNVTVQAVHDGDTIALRLSWADRQADTNDLRTQAFEDAVAVGVYRGESEPFLGMGMTKEPIELWMWDADRQDPQTLEEVNPRMVVDHYPLVEGAVASAEYNRAAVRKAEQLELLMPALAGGNPICPRPGGNAATTLEAAGPGSVTFRPPVNQSVQATGTWQDGRWSVVMTRKLDTTKPQGCVPLEPGESVSVAFAIWNGSQRDRNGQKLITIWQDLVLE